MSELYKLPETTVDQPDTYRDNLADALFNPHLADASAVATPADTVASVENEKDAGSDVIDVLLPDAIVVGETHGNLPGVGTALKGGNFALISTETGGATYFGARPVKPLPSVPTPLGEIKQGISIVGSSNTASDEAGVGYTAKVPTPAGDVLLFANARGGDGARLRDALSGDLDGTVSVNLGAAYSVSDGAILGLSSTLPGGTVFAAAAAELTGFDGWAGVAYRATADFEDGQLVSVKIGNTEIPIEEFGAFFGQALAPEDALTDISGNALTIAVSLFNAYVEGGASPEDAAAWAQAAYDDGGLSGVTEKAIEVIGANVPKAADGGANVTDGSFRALGMDDDAAGFAKQAYDTLRSGSDGQYYSPTDAWSAVWSAYLDGYHDGSVTGEQGVKDGGKAGGLEALREFAFDLQNPVDISEDV